MKISTQFQRAEGLVVMSAAVYLYYGFLQAPWQLFLMVILLPDLFMAGYLVSKPFGAFIYNLGHVLAFPVLLLTIGVVGEQEIYAQVGLIWAAHIGGDRMLGYGLKTAKGFTHTHLGKIGKK